MADDLRVQVIVELLKKGSIQEAINELENLDKTSKRVDRASTLLTRQVLRLFAAFGGWRVLTESLRAFAANEQAVKSLGISYSALSGSLTSTQRSFTHVKEALGGLVATFGAQQINNLRDFNNGLATLMNAAGRWVNSPGGRLVQSMASSAANFTGLGLAARLMPEPQPNAMTGVTPGAQGMRGSLMARSTRPAQIGPEINTKSAEQADDHVKAWLEANQKLNEEETDLAQERMQRAKEVSATEFEFHNRLTETKLEGEALAIQQAEVAHLERLQQIRELTFEDESRYEQLIVLEGKLHQAQLGRIQEARSASKLFEQDMKQVAQAGSQAFASGLATAIVDSFEEGDKAFQRFAANFLRLIAEMILQALILKALRSALPGLGFAHGGQAPAIKAAEGVHGVQPVNRPTFFPRFNVLAGEAGPEVMTVMANPAISRIGDITAQLGSVQGRRMALLDASDLVKLGSGGSVGAMPAIGTQQGPGKMEITVRLEQGLKAGIVSDAVEASAVRVTRDLSNDTAMSQAAKRLNS